VVSTPWGLGAAGPDPEDRSGEATDHPTHGATEETHHPGATTFSSARTHGEKPGKSTRFLWMVSDGFCIQIPSF